MKTYGFYIAAAYSITLIVLSSHLGYTLIRYYKLRNKKSNNIHSAAKNNAHSLA